jgi:molecular chaperone GrpE
MKKELAHDAIRMGARVKEGLIEDILPALDSFDMATATEAWASIDDGWRNGMENVQNQLLEALKRNGVERFGKVGEMANPHLHEILQELSDVSGESGEIVRVLRSGYKAGERVIRAAQVIVKA